jgi:hypothetical protein
MATPRPVYPRKKLWYPFLEELARDEKQIVECVASRYTDGIIAAGRFAMTRVG